MAGMSGLVGHSSHPPAPTAQRSSNRHSALLRFGIRPVTTASGVISIHSDEEREFNITESNPKSSTSKSKAMAITGPDSKATPAADTTCKNLKRKLNDYLKSSDTVEILVGPERTKWILNEELLCDRIDYFKAAFKNGLKESKDKKLELPEDSPEVFARLVDWVYTEWLVCPICDDDDYANPSIKGGKLDSNHLLLWARLWVLADKLGSKKLMDKAESKFMLCIDEIEFGVAPEVISFVFEEMPESCRLRKLLPNVFLHFFFKSGAYLEPFGEAAASSKIFNSAFLKLVKEHTQKTKEYCYISECVQHKTHA